MGKTLVAIIGFIVGAFLVLVSYILGKRDNNNVSSVSFSSDVSNNVVKNVTNLAENRALILERYQKLQRQANTIAENAENLSDESVNELTRVLDEAINLSRELTNEKR